MDDCNSFGFVLYDKGGKFVKKKFVREDGSFTIEATMISMIVFLIVINIIAYVFIMYDKNKVSSVINEVVLNEINDENISSGDISSKIHNELNDKLYATSINGGGVNVNIMDDTVCDVTVKIATNSKIYSLAKLLTKKDYMLEIKVKDNCADMMEQVYKKIKIKK